MAQNLTNPELEARILENVDDVAAYLVYADWLSERGDPRGELVAVQARLAETPDDPALKAREAALLATHAKDWLGPLAGQGDKHVAVTWRLGFVDAIRLGPPVDAYETSELVSPETIEAIMRLPHADLVRTLILGSKDYDDYPTSWDDLVQALAEQGVPRGLSRLSFDCGGMWDISSTELGDLSVLYPRLQRLRELHVHMGAMTFGAMDLPELRSLEVVTGGLTSENVASIRDGRWPKLERLSLCIGETDNDYGCTVQLDDVLALLASPGLASVRHLGLANSSLADEIAAALPGSRILPQLRTLDLSRGAFGDAGARVLLDHADAFAHLESIDLTWHYVSDALAAELANLGPRVVLDDPQEADDDGDYGIYRYVQISE
ncbi:MAG: TIGR02996 domain-containing protein [Myxococcales bacterium]|nr:TIGR02996 domain-containing protein [Myxococcales bacterium]